MSFVMAENQCMQLGGHLISIPNGFVDLFIAQQAESSFANGSSSSRFWIGISNINGNSWQNVDNGSTTNFFDWASGEPGNTTDNGCVSMDTTGKWYNDGCFSNYSFACGVSEVGAPTTPGPTGATVSYSSLTCPSYISFTFPTGRSNEIWNMVEFIRNQFLPEIFAPDIQPAPLREHSGMPSSVGEIICFIDEVPAFLFNPNDFPRGDLPNLYNPIMDYNDGIPINVVQFTAVELNISRINDARNYTNQWTSKGHTVTVVLVDPSIDQTNFKLVPGLNIVPWSDPATLLPAIRQNMKCGGGSPVYHPCKTWVAFVPDFSCTLSKTDFNTQITFISTEIGRFNHPERILLKGVYSTDSPLIPWYGTWGIPYIQHEISTIFQTTSTSYTLNGTLYMIYNNYFPKEYCPQHILPEPPMGILIFISDTSSPADYKVDDNIVNLLKSLGMKLTFVLLGPKPDQSKLSKYTDSFVNWRDMSKPQPDNWDQVYLDAYNCPK